MEWIYRSLIKSKSGQVSIMVAIIFQIVFIFFAMVVNVGLLIHDKINLQNSVDIAAYYGAMKQAEDLNAIAHVNYELRQIYKLLVWRMWSLGDAGRNLEFQSMIGPSGGGAITDDSAVWRDGYNHPVVCVRHSLWYDENAQRSFMGSVQNLCKDSSFKIPQMKPYETNFVQDWFPELKIFGDLSKKNSEILIKDCKSAGVKNYQFAYNLLKSFKVAMQQRRYAIHELQKLLIESPAGHQSDFRDLTGRSVADTAIQTFRANLSAANAATAQVEFNTSLHNMPFLVPIEVRVFLLYLDMYGGGVHGSEPYGCTAEPKPILQAPEVTSTDSVSAAEITEITNFIRDLGNPDADPHAVPLTADGFNNLSTNQLRSRFASLVGFEKDPWVTAYVRVQAKSTPRMLFGPLGAPVQLRAEAFAMPFGGKIGPWFFRSWMPGAPFSTDGGKVDNLMPPRIGSGESSAPDVNLPNYSRYPGDRLGMKSKYARTVGLKAMWAPGDPHNFPRFNGGEYSNLGTGWEDAKSDPVVGVDSSRGLMKFRATELASIAPDLFDAAYYSINNNFNGWATTKSNGNFFQQQCPWPMGTCLDLGTTFSAGGIPTAPFTIDQQVSTNADPNFNPLGNEAYWVIRNKDHLNTSWAQDSTDTYFSGVPKRIGKSDAEGGRSGYSVKIVSRRFLNRTDLPFGSMEPDNVIKGPIKNPPAAMPQNL